MFEDSMAFLNVLIMLKLIPKFKFKNWSKLKFFLCTFWFIKFILTEIRQTKSSKKFKEFKHVEVLFRFIDESVS